MINLRNQVAIWGYKNTTFWVGIRKTDAPEILVNPIGAKKQKPCQAQFSKIMPIPRARVS